MADEVIPSGVALKSEVDDRGPRLVVGPIAPSLDSDKFDSLGNRKTDDQTPGSGKGPTAPLDSFSVDEIAAKNKAAQKKLETSNLSDSVDSRGMKKGSFEVTPQGLDKHGARIPDKVDYSKPLDAPAIHGPRGKNAPKDSFQN